MSSSSYQTISSLNRELLNSGVTKKRSALSKLAAHLQDSQFRQQLYQEAGGRSASRHRKQLALSTLWNSIIGNSIMAVQHMITGKAKATGQDVLYLKALLHQYALHGTNESVQPHLSRENIRKLREFCITSLAHEMALEVAELQLLRLLQSICVSKEYISSYKSSELGEILSEIEVRLELKEEDDEESEVMEEAAKALESLVKTTCLTLRLAMHHFVAAIMELVSNRCKLYLQEPSDVQVNTLLVLINTASIVMKTHPEQAIVPLERDGGAMLSFSKRRYPRSDLVPKETLIEYFHSHL